MIRIVVPVRAVSLTNQREHWRDRHRRARAERETVWACWRQAPYPAIPPSWTSATVTLTRIAPRALDPGDNLPAALKSVRDQVAAELGVDDASDLVVWRYAQERGAPRQHSVQIEISFATAKGERSP